MQTYVTYLYRVAFITGTNKIIVRTPSWSLAQVSRYFLHNYSCQIRKKDEDLSILEKP